LGRHGPFGLLMARARCADWVGFPSERKGATVAHKRPTASDVVPPIDIANEDIKPEAWAALTRAEAHAMRRSTPLTPEQFKSRRRLAEQGVNPLRRL
jgi:hypothetical protein